MRWVRIITGTVCVHWASLAELFKNDFPVLRIKCKMHFSEWRCWSCAHVWFDFFFFFASCWAVIDAHSQVNIYL